METVENRGRSVSWAAALLLGAAVAVGLGVYGRLHEPGSVALYTLGFSGQLPMKAWLSTVVLIFAVLQVVTALWMWGRLPGVGTAPAWVGPVHRWSGTIAFVVSLPVAFACLWTLGFRSGDVRVLVHSIAGCLFYGAFAAKMIGLRLRAAPRWALPVLGGTAFTLIVLLWLTSALWLFTTPGSAKI
ncbi:DUF6529 family protein [Occultella kanbiaonis]|uniref:DUF6529 family protein n=1 Tax=Occultella kanbiaonis TaxID=2675754 RepID=UPI0013D3199F|nr:DUF6529 family protein [Occultella kanbiaonis]